MNRQGVAFIGLTAVVSFLLGLVVAGTRPPSPTDALPVPRAASDLSPIQIPSNTTTTGPAIVSGPADFGAVAEKLNAAVVNVDTASRGRLDALRPSRRGRTDPSPARGLRQRVHHRSLGLRAHESSRDQRRGPRHGHLE